MGTHGVAREQLCYFYICASFNMGYKKEKAVNQYLGPTSPFALDSHFAVQSKRACTSECIMGLFWVILSPTDSRDSVWEPALPESWFSVQISWYSLYNSYSVCGCWRHIVLLLGQRRHDVIVQCWFVVSLARVLQTTEIRKTTKTSKNEQISLKTQRTQDKSSLC